MVNKPVYFEDADWPNPLAKAEGWRLFRVGTVEGAWRCDINAYEILAIVNHAPGNGHLDIALGHFTASCKRDNKNLIIREMMNQQFAFALIRRGFTFLNKKDLIRRFKK